MQREMEIVGSKVKLLEEELGVLGNDFSALRRDHRTDADTFRLEIETLKLILDQIVPNFSEKYAEMKEKARLEIIPE
jgi:hypothetical protein